MTTEIFPTGRSARPAALDRLLAVRIAVTWELVFYAAVFAAAFALRFWDLGSRALHHDESIHAQWSWNLLRGDYTHSPIFHGPLYYHVQAVVFLVFGDNDYTSRVSAALFGCAIVALPLLLRRRLGALGTFAAVAFIAFSPTLVYYSRFFREDIYMAAFTLLTVVSTWRYMEDGRDRWLYSFAAAFVGAVLVKEGAFLTFAVFLVYFDVHLSADLARRTLAERELDGDRWRVWAMTFFYAPYAWIIAALWPYLPGFHRKGPLPRSGDLLVLLGTLTLPLLTPVSRVFLLEPLGIVEDGRLDWQAKFAGGHIAASDALALAGLFAVTTAAAAFVGLQWKPKVWAIAFVVGTAVYLTFMTSFWTNGMGLVSGPWGSLDYWYAQHDETRGDQPWFYYYLLMPAYEFLPLALAVGGAWWSIVRGTPFSRFLWVWLGGMWLALSWGGEKMPWLNVHLAVPACLLAAWTLQRAWDAWRDRPDVRALVVPLSSVAAIAAGALTLFAYMPGGAAYLALRVLLLAGLAVGVAWVARPFGARSAGMFAATACIAGLAFLSLHTMISVVYERGDVPKDMLIYTQSSPAIPDIMADIERLGEATGLGHDLPIAVDSTDSFAWPWAWYLRDYHRVLYSDMSNGAPQGDYQVLLVAQSNASRVNDSIATLPIVFGSPERYPHRWWFDERYKSAMSVNAGQSCTTKGGACGPFRLATWKHIFSNVFDGSWPRTWAEYIRDHDPDELYGVTAGDERCNACGSVDAWAYFPANFDRATGVLSAQPLQPPAPTVDADGNPQFGGYGLLPGQFLAPVDVEADGDGNLYVIDSSTRRLQKFDAEGNYLASVDVRGEGNIGQASEPWGLAVAPDGRVYVADTFGWRVLIFDRDLKPVGTFGEAPKSIDPAIEHGPYELYGPRDIAIDGDGNLWVTDTGFGRIQVYTPEGEYIRTIGGPGTGDGQFQEPVGIDIADDGAVFAADMFNGRLVILGPDGSWTGSFPVDGWGGQGVQDKPYVEALAGGNVAISLPSRDEVRVYARDGSLVATVTGGSEALESPYGLLDAGDGSLWVVSGGAGTVRRLPLP